MLCSQESIAIIPDEQLLAGDVSVTGGVSGIVIDVSASLNGAQVMAVFSGGVSGIAAATAGSSDTAHVTGGVSITSRDSVRPCSGIVAGVSHPPISISFDGLQSNGCIMHMRYTTDQSDIMTKSIRILVHVMTGTWLYFKRYTAILVTDVIVCDVFSSSKRTCNAVLHGSNVSR